MTMGRRIVLIQSMTSGAMLSHQGTKRLSHRFLEWLDRDLSALELPRRYPFSLWKLSAHIDATVHDV